MTGSNGVVKFQLITSFLHFLHTRPASSLSHFLHSFDACIHQPASAWEFWCLSTEERQQSLRRACATTALQPMHYPADNHINSDDGAEEHLSKTLATAGASWPCAIPPSAHCLHLASYRSNFEQIVQPPQVCAFCACAVWNDESVCRSSNTVPIPHYATFFRHCGTRALTHRSRAAQRHNLRAFGGRCFLLRWIEIDFFWMFLAYFLVVSAP